MDRAQTAVTASSQTASGQHRFRPAPLSANAALRHSLSPEQVTPVQARSVLCLCVFVLCVCVKCGVVWCGVVCRWGPPYRPLPDRSPPDPLSAGPSLLQTAQIFALFSLFPPHFHSFFLSWGSSRGILVFLNAGALKRARLEFSGCRVRSRGSGPGAGRSGWRAVPGGGRG